VGSGSLRNARSSFSFFSWTIAFSSFYAGSPLLEVNVRSDRSSAHHVRESLKRSLDVSD